MNIIKNFPSSIRLCKNRAKLSFPSLSLEQYEQNNFLRKNYRYQLIKNLNLTKKL